MTNRIGDRPRFPLSNQRFDKGDAENIARYYEEIISRFTGSIYGQAWGCMSNPQFEVVTGSPAGPYIRPKRCVLLYTVPADGTLNTTDQDLGPWNATIVQFDPARAGQPVQSLYTGTYLPTGRPPLRPWILFRRSEAATNTGNKAYWDTDSNTEEVGAAPLQDSEYVEFRLSTTYSSGDRGAGWYRCAYIDSWGSPASAATPVIVPVHWMDSQYYADSTPPVQGTLVASALASLNYVGGFGQKGFSPLTEMPELAKLMHWMAGKLGEHYSTASTIQITPANQATYNLKPGAFLSTPPDGLGGWLSTPPRGLLELHQDLDELATDVAAADAALTTSIGGLSNSFSTFITSYRATARLLHVMYVTPTPGSPSFWQNYTFNVTLGSIVTEYTPRLGIIDSPIAVIPPPQLKYKFTPIAGDPDDAGPRYMAVVLDLQCPEMVGEPSYIVSAVNVVGVQGALTSQTYSVVSPSSIPPSTNAQLTFHFTNPNTDRDIITPFTVYIYGRNI